MESSLKKKIKTNNSNGIYLDSFYHSLDFLGMAWEDEKPKEAKALTLGATIAVIVIMEFVFAKLIAASFVYMFHSIFFF